MKIRRILLVVFPIAVTASLFVGFYCSVVQPKYQEYEKEIKNLKGALEVAESERVEEIESQNIIKDCHERAEERASGWMKAKIDSGMKGPVDPNELVTYHDKEGNRAGVYSRSDYENEFDACLRSKGFLEIPE